MRKSVNVSLTSPVLVLNRLWQPVHVCSAKRALCLLVLNHAEVVETYGPNEFCTHSYQQWIVRSAELAKKGSDIGYASSPSVTLAVTLYGALDTTGLDQIISPVFSLIVMPEGAALSA